MAFNTNQTLVGLTSTSWSVPTAGVYTCSGTLSLPTIVDGGGSSSVVTTINQNSSPIYTGTAGATGFATTIGCAAGDVIQVAFTSSNSDDAGLNAVKSVISFG